MRKQFLLIILFLFVKICFSSVPEIKTYDNQLDLIDGKAEGISINWNGELLLAPSIKEIYNSNRLIIWDLVSDQKRNVFAATGDGAKIHQITPGGKTNIIAEWDDVEVYSLAVDNKAMLYAATSPDGKIYRFHENKGPELFVDLDVKYIWDLIFDKQNNCYAATGDSGAILKINEQGEISNFYKSDETHIRCLAWDGDNNLIAGSYPNGYVYRINSAGQAFIIYDSEYQEIHKICIANNGTIYAAGLTTEKSKKIIIKPPTPDSQSKPPSEASEIFSISAKPVDSPRVSGSGILKIHPGGFVKNIWKPNGDHVQSIVLTKAEMLLVGTGDKGRLYRVSPLEERDYLLNFKASQIVSIINGPENSFWIATSNLGKIFQLKQEIVKKGTNKSKIIDTKTMTHWGTSSVKLYSRTGNTGKPNSTWSPWSQLTNNEIISSPGARFIQWKVELSTKDASISPRVRNIKLSYLQQNVPPEILSITIHALQRQTQLQPTSIPPPSTMNIVLSERGGTGSQRQAPQQTARRQLRNGYRRVSWKARDENNDELAYHLFFQEKNEDKCWVLKKDVTRTSYTWDTRMMPDGHYRIKIIADDAKSNPINTEKKTEKISDWFVVDNTTPSVENVSVQKIQNDSLQIYFETIDKLSSIKQVQISHDFQKWLWVFPKDLVCDSKKEIFKFNIKRDPNQFHSIIIKVTDNAENIGYSRVSIGE